MTTNSSQPSTNPSPLQNLEAMYKRGVFSRPEFAQALRNLYKQSPINEQPFVRRRLQAVLRAEAAA